MKKFLYLLLAVMCIIPLALTSCKTDKPSTPAGAEPALTTAPDDEGTDDANDGSYRIVRAENATDWEIKAAGELSRRYKERTGKELPIVIDSAEKTTPGNEIIIGKTNRAGTGFDAEHAQLKKGGFAVKTSGKRIVLLANDSVGMTAAVEHYYGQTAINGSFEGFNSDGGYDYMYNIPEKAKNTGFVKAMWLSQYDLEDVYKNNKVQRDAADFTKLVGKMLDNCVSIGINTVIVQVRPNADSMYPSEYYPASAYVTGAYGKEFTYDPFAIIVNEANERGLVIHAWINPMRGMTTEQIESVGDDFTVKQWWKDTTKKTTYLTTVSGRVYLNPAYEDVRKLIIDGAAEILERYAVDGVHMDDYFYPVDTTKTDFDSAAFKQYANGLNLADFRRENLNKLVSGLYSAVKAKNPDALYGISPAGNINTVYDSHCADVYKWLSGDGYVDYICPQDYFGMQHQNWAFPKTAGLWKAAVKNDKIDVWLGITLGKAINGYDGTGDKYAGTGKNEWVNSKDVIKKCLEYVKSDSDISGVSFFCYQYFWDPVSGTAVTKTAAERANFLPVLNTLK